VTFFSAFADWTDETVLRRSLVHHRQRRKAKQSTGCVRPSGVRMSALKPLNSYFDGIKTTIFSVMSALAVEHSAVNLGQV
jgi:hypothetical protein